MQRGADATALAVSLFDATILAGAPRTSTHHRVGSVPANAEVVVGRDGRAIVQGSVMPLADAARALLTEGVLPATPLVMRHAEAGHDGLTSTVGVAAPLTVHDSEKGKPKFKRWRSDGRFSGQNEGAAAPGSAQNEAAATSPAAE